MNKEDFKALMEEHFSMENHLSNFAITSLALKSHTFFYRDIFQGANNLKIFSLISKDKEIAYEIQYFSLHIQGLCSGYFLIVPQNDISKKIIAKKGQITTSILDYFFEVYQNEDILRNYLISGNINSTSVQKDNALEILYQEQKQFLASFTPQEIALWLLPKKNHEKYIIDFLRFNKKPDKNIVDLLLTLFECKTNIYFVNNRFSVPNTIYIQSSMIHSAYNIYQQIEYSQNNNCFIFIQFIYDFEG